MILASKCKEMIHEGGIGWDFHGNEQKRLFLKLYAIILYILYQRFSETSHLTFTSAHQDLTIRSQSDVKCKLLVFVKNDWVQTS